EPNKRSTIKNQKNYLISNVIKRLKLIAPFSSPLLALLNDFVIALNPFEADHIVPRIPIESNPPLLLLTSVSKLSLIISETSPGKNESRNRMTDSLLRRIDPINVTRKGKDGNKDNKKKYASCADKPATSASLVRPTTCFIVFIFSVVPHQLPTTSLTLKQYLFYKLL